MPPLRESSHKCWTILPKPVEPLPNRELASGLPKGTVLYGEIFVWKDGRVATLNLLQQRNGRKAMTTKVLAYAPVGFIA